MCVCDPHVLETVLEGFLYGIIDPKLQNSSKIKEIPCINLMILIKSVWCLALIQEARSSGYSDKVWCQQNNREQQRTIAGYRGVAAVCFKD